MRFSIPFSRHKDLCENADELDITYDSEKNSFPDLVAFCRTYSTKRINIQPVGMMPLSVKEMSAISQTCENVRWRLSEVNVRKAEQLFESKVPFFFDRNCPARSFVELDFFLTLGVCAVYIADDVTYFLDAAKNLCKNKRVDLRIVLNRIGRTFSREEDETVFFVRPEDMNYAKLFFDVAEFNCGDIDTYDFKKATVLHRVYFEQGYWDGNIQEIVEDFPYQLPNQSLLKQTTYRWSCAHRCMTQGSRCRRCYLISDAAKKLAAKDIKIGR